MEKDWLGQYMNKMKAKYNVTRNNSNFYTEGCLNIILGEAFILNPWDVGKMLTRCLNHRLPWIPSVSKNPLSASISRSFNARFFNRKTCPIVSCSRSFCKSNKWMFRRNSKCEICLILVTVISNSLLYNHVCNLRFVFSFLCCSFKFLYGSSYRMQRNAHLKQVA